MNFREQNLPEKSLRKDRFEGIAQTLATLLDVATLPTFFHIKGIDLNKNEVEPEVTRRFCITFHAGIQCFIVSEATPTRPTATVFAVDPSGSVIAYDDSVPYPIATRLPDTADKRGEMERLEKPSEAQSLAQKKGELIVRQLAKCGFKENWGPPRDDWKGFSR